jgi:hypothetical protein
MELRRRCPGLYKTAPVDLIIREQYIKNVIRTEEKMSLKFINEPGREPRPRRIRAGLMGVCPPAVSLGIRRLKQRMKKDRGLKKCMEIMLNIKTPLFFFDRPSCLLV